MEARDYEIVYSDIEIQRDLDKPNIASCKLFAKLPQPQPSL